jgi:hypothetical protein
MFPLPKMEHTGLSTSFSPSVASFDDQTPRHLKERTESHYCVKCLSEIPVDEYLRNDFLCDNCAKAQEYPLQSTPEKDGR